MNEEELNVAAGETPADSPAEDDLSREIGQTEAAEAQDGSAPETDGADISENVPPTGDETTDGEQTAASAKKSP